MLQSRVTVYLPRLLWCANYWNKLDKWHSNWGSSLNPYRLWITIILNITCLIIRSLKGVDTKLRVNYGLFVKYNSTSGIVVLPPPGIFCVFVLNSAIAVLTRHARLATTFDPGRKLCAYALRRFEFQYFRMTWLCHTEAKRFHFDHKIIDSLFINHFTWECNKSQGHACFLLRLSTITPFVEWFGVLRS